MTKEEAIRRIKSWNLDSDDMEVLSVVIPELAESEDEKVRKELLEEIEFIVPHEDETDSEGLILPSYRTRIDRYKSYLEKRKEQKQDEGDFTIYHPQKNGDGKYKCIPFSFYGSLTSFSNDKDLMDFLNECFYDKEECERWCEVENKPELPECNHKVKKDSVFDYLCESSGDEKQKEQKPAEWSEDDADFINMLILHFIYLINKGGDSVETYKSYIEKLKSLRPHLHCKPSEEQMEALNEIINTLAASKHPHESDYLFNRLNGLRKNLKKL